MVAVAFLIGAILLLQDHLCNDGDDGGDDDDDGFARVWGMIAMCGWADGWGWICGWMGMDLRMNVRMGT